MRSPPDGLRQPLPWLGLCGAILAAEWLRNPSQWWAGAILLVALAAMVVGLRAGGRSRAILAGLGIVAVAVALAQRQVVRFEHEWPRERESRLQAAFKGLAGELRAAYESTEQLAERASRLADGDQAATFAQLDRELPRDRAEMAVAILEPTGVPWAWAGRHRLAPQAEGNSPGARLTRFYGTMESRRVTARGRIVVASTLIWADSSVPRPDRSLAARFGAAAGVQLLVFPPGSAPANAELFDYTTPTDGGEALLFSVQPVPPDQSASLAAARREAEAWAAWGIVALLALLLFAASGEPRRLFLLGALVWCTLRAPFGRALGLDDLFSPATFFHSALRPVTQSAGNLLITGGALLLLALWMWGLALPRRPWRVALGAMVLLAAPFLVLALGRGVSPPVAGVTPALWVSWQFTLAIVTSALILLSAALVRGAETPRAGGPSLGLAVGLAIVAAVIGLVLWEPLVGWPSWYSLLWLPGLALAAFPRPRWQMIVCATMVAGTAAALVTWGAEQSGRVTAAQRDLALLGDSDDPLAGPLLERLSEAVARGSEPSTAPALFMLWRASDLAGQEYPARLALWEPDGSRFLELALDSLDLPAPLLSALVRGFDSTATREVVAFARVPGRHYVLLHRTPSGRVLTVAVGPRTRLLAPTRLGRLLRAPGEGSPLYDLTLTPPFARPLRAAMAGRWWREGREIRTDRLLDFAGGSRQVHALVELRPFSMLLVRGSLLLVANLLVVIALVFLATIRWGDLRRRLSPSRLARSFQVRLALTLAAFFIVPASGFALWGLGRLQNEADRTRDLLITSVLRDAVLTAGGLLQEPTEYLEQGLVDLSNRLDADLVLYSGGRLVAASAPILRELSLVEPLMEARSFQRMALGEELELTRQATTYVAPVRVGYRVAQAGPPGGIGILATPQLTFDWARVRNQLDLKYVLVLATLTGILAAVLGAQLAARTLSRPVADLGRSARALGLGQPLPAVDTPPAEFETVFAAFGHMADDIRQSQAALEGARQRTAAVLANVATGVVALDGAGHIILANARARQLVGSPLEPGEALHTLLDDSWAELFTALDLFRGGGEPALAADIESGGRTWRVQFAPLGRGPEDGVVLALDDLTEPTRAARVLAWGEMARQVAHEIKNPLTPIRLGVQHLRRVRRERPERFDAVLEETVERILGEIDRLDTIARAFSRFGLPGGAAGPLEQVDLVATATEVVALYRLSGDGAAVELEGETGLRLPARRDEFKEVLGNLVENARNAGATRVRIEFGPGRCRVVDDGAGIPADVLPRLFEPRFSATTSGSGLGLAIVRRLVEGWGATVDLESQAGRGTVATIRWP